MQALFTLTDPFSVFTQTLAIVSALITIVGAFGALSRRARLNRRLAWINRAYTREPTGNRKETLRLEIAQIESSLFAMEHIDARMVFIAGFSAALTVLNSIAIPRLGPEWDTTDLTFTCIGTGLVAFMFTLKIQQFFILHKVYFLAANVLREGVQVEAFLWSGFNNYSGSLAEVASPSLVAFLAAGSAVFAETAENWLMILGLVGLVLVGLVLLGNEKAAFNYANEKIEGLRRPLLELL